MAWTPGISPRDLEEKIIKENLRFKNLFEDFQVYSDTPNDTLRVWDEKSTKKQKHIVARNLATYHKKILELNKCNENLTILYNLYNQFFPDSEFDILDDYNLIKQIILTSDRANKAEEGLLRRLSSNYLISLMTLPSSAPEYIFPPEPIFQIDTETW